jgi:hypothetical protein
MWLTMTCELTPAVSRHTIFHGTVLICPQLFLHKGNPIWPIPQGQTYLYQTGGFRETRPHFGQTLRTQGLPKTLNWRSSHQSPQEKQARATERRPQLGPTTWECKSTVLLCHNLQPSVVTTTSHYIWTLGPTRQAQNHKRPSWLPGHPWFQATIQ